MPEWVKANNTAVITGAASGIGLAAAQHFANHGMNVVLADRDESLLESAKQAIASDTVASLVTDVSDMDAVQTLQQFAQAQFGDVHCLMNNAGASLRQGKPWEDLDKFKQQIQINFWGVVHGCHAFIPDMLAHQNPCAVINTGSKQGITKPPGNHAYNLSKTAVIAYTESIAHGLRDIEDCQLSAHLLIPGFTYTGMIIFIKLNPISNR